MSTKIGSFNATWRKGEGFLLECGGRKDKVDQKERGERDVVILEKKKGGDEKISKLDRDLKIFRSLETI